MQAISYKSMGGRTDTSSLFFIFSLPPPLKPTLRPSQAPQRPSQAFQRFSVWCSLHFPAPFEAFQQGNSKNPEECLSPSETLPDPLRSPLSPFQRPFLSFPLL